jgi:hypothetical protein
LKNSQKNKNMKSGFKMRSGNASSFKMMGSSPAKNKGELPNLSGTTSKEVDLTKKPVGPVAGNKKTEKTKKPTETKKSTVAVDGSLKDAQSDYERDLKIKNQKTLDKINKQEAIGDEISEGTIESQDLRRKENNN